MKTQIYPEFNQNVYAAHQGGEANVIAMMKDCWVNNIPTFQSLWFEGTVDLRYKSGDQQMWKALYSSLAPTSRKMYHINKILRVIKHITGMQRQGRKSTICTPLRDDAYLQQEADDRTASLMWAYNQDRTLERFSDGFEACISAGGINFIESWLDFRTDPVNGDLRHSVVPFTGMFFDPFSEELDMSDAAYMWTRKWKTKEYAASLYPDAAKDIWNLPTAQMRDNKFIYQPQTSMYTRRKDLVAIDEFHYLATRTAKCLVDRKSGQTIELKHGYEFDDHFMRFWKDRYEIRDIEKTTTKLAVVMGPMVVYHGPNPLHIDRYPFTAQRCYFENAFNDWSYRWQSLSRVMRDPQFIYNRRKLIELDILESQINSGEIVKESFYKSPDEMKKIGQGAIRIVNDDANIQTDRLQVDAPSIPPQLMEFSKQFGDEISEVMGMNEQSMGLADDKISGLVTMLRQSAGMVGKQDLFDGCDQSQKNMGELDIEIMQQNWNPQKFEAILGREVSAGIKDPIVMKFGVIVEEGALTASQRQMEALQVKEIMEMGAPVPWSFLINKMNIQGKNELIKVMDEQSKQQSEQANRQAQLEQENMAVENTTLLAKAESDKALASERMAKILFEQSLNVERIASARNESTQSVLNMAKAVKEMQSMNMDNIERGVNIMAVLQDKMTERAIEQEEKVAQTAV